MSKIIAITGAGVGLGRTLARRFAEDGDTVVLLGRTFSKVEAVAAEIGERAMGVHCDVASPESVRSAFSKIAEHHPRIDVLINNAAIYEPFLIAEASDEQILGAIGTNLAGPILCTRSAIPMMEPGGHIINISSESVEVLFPQLSIYRTTKAGLEMFSKALEHELEPKGIRVTTVRAGPMKEEGKTWDVDREAAMRFTQAALAAGLNLRERPGTHVSSVTGIFRAIIDMPADLNVGVLTLHARRAD